MRMNTTQKDRTKAANLALPGLRPGVRTLLPILSVLWWAFDGPAQFVAFNDHYAAPTTHSNATAWNVFGTTGGAPGNAGPLKNITNGVPLLASRPITRLA